MGGGWFPIQSFSNESSLYSIHTAQLTVTTVPAGRCTWLDMRLSALVLLVVLTTVKISLQQQQVPEVESIFNLAKAGRSFVLNVLCETGCLK
jgi:hypothetical protein